MNAQNSSTKNSTTEVLFSSSFLKLFIPLVFFLSLNFSAKSQQIPLIDNEIHLGVASCAGSTCHGAVAPLPGSNVLQNEFITWHEKDKHSKAYKVLLNQQSKRIAKNLGLKSAHTAEICLNCHSDNVPQNKRHSTFKISDGVTCEACHGGAGRWIGTHITPIASHSNNIKNGLYPTSDPTKRAELCLSCHFGDNKRLVTHRIMGAGHPRISFELETFTALEPAHFVVDKDYYKRGKTSVGSVKTWAIGQAMSINMMLDVLLDPQIGMDGFFPELVVFDCHACHRPMSKLQWAKREGTGNLGPGIPKFNDSNLLMLQVVTSQIDPNLGKDLKSSSIKLHESFRESRDSMIIAASNLKNTTKKLISTFEKHDFSSSDVKSILNTLINNAIKGEYVDYAGAEQASMAIASLVNGMSDMGILKNSNLKNINGGLEKIYTTVDNAENYKPKLFVESLQQFKQKIKY